MLIDRCMLFMQTSDCSDSSKCYALAIYPGMVIMQRFMQM